MKPSRKPKRQPIPALKPIGPKRLRLSIKQFLLILLGLTFTLYIASNAVCMTAAAINNHLNLSRYSNTAPIGDIIEPPLPEDYAEEPCSIPMPAEPSAPTIPEIYLPSEPLLPSVPLTPGIQWRIFTEACHGDPVRFCLIMAMANPESGYDPSKIGDDGRSFGIIQIMAEWHEDRLAKYGFTVEDLLDPVKCCIVGIDYLEWINDHWPDSSDGPGFYATHKLLMRYNMGPSGAATAICDGHESSYYSREVMPIYEDFLSEFRFPGDLPEEFSSEFAAESSST